MKSAHINDYKYTEKRIPSRDLTLFHKLDRTDIDWRRVREDSITFSYRLKFISSACVNHYMYVPRKTSVILTCVMCCNKHTDSRLSLKNSGFRNCLFYWKGARGWSVSIYYLYHTELCVISYLPPAMKLGQGYVFTRVCDSVHRGDLQWPPLHAGIHPHQRQAPPPHWTRGRHPSPSAVHAGRYGQQTGGTHPTGMQSCLILWTVIFSLSRLRTLLFGLLL